MAKIGELIDHARLINEDDFNDIPDDVIMQLASGFGLIEDEEVETRKRPLN